jgi:8-oxo-dGTP pyrophosphatase MutT (NUDIX family)
MAEAYRAGSSRQMAAGALFRDGAGRVLLVEPSYKPNWDLPGGLVEADESPWAAAARELMEELGWNRPLGRLLVVDHLRAEDSTPESVLFVFDGGVLTEEDLADVEFPDGELLSASFHTVAQARGKVLAPLAYRLEAALEALGQGVTALCEQGRRIS